MALRIIAITLACVTSARICAGELSAQDGVPAFQVVSVKPNASGDTNSTSIVQPGARYTATNATAADAHQACLPGPRRPDRFQLALHRETRDIPVYALMIARRDGRFGPQFRRAVETCSGPSTPLPVASDAPEPIPELPCDGGFSRAGHIGARAREFSTLLRSLSTWTDRVLIDRTELSGRFDWDLQWTLESSSPEVTAVANRLPLVTALREQLGMRLEAQRSAADVLVVDRAERPQPD